MFKCFKEAIWTLCSISSEGYLELLKEDTFMIQVIYIKSGGGFWGPETDNLEIKSWMKYQVIKLDVKLVFGL